MSTVIAKQLIQPIIQRPNDMLMIAQALEISDQETFDTAGEFRKVCKDFKIEIEKSNAEPKQTSHVAWKAAVDREKRELAPVLAADVLLKSKREKYQAEQDRIRKEAQEAENKAAEAQAKKDREAAALARIDDGGSDEEIDAIMSMPIVAYTAPVPAMAKTAGVSGYYKYSAELIDRQAFVDAAIVDPSLTPYLIPDEKAINALAAAQKEAFNITGFKIVKTYVEPVRS